MAPDPLENCHLNVKSAKNFKKIAKNFLKNSKKLPWAILKKKNIFGNFFEKNLAKCGNSKNKKNQVFGNFFDKNVKFLTFKLQFSVGTDWHKFVQI